MEFSENEYNEDLYENEYDNETDDTYLDDESFVEEDEECFSVI